MFAFSAKISSRHFRRTFEKFGALQLFAQLCPLKAEGTKRFDKLDAHLYDQLPIGSGSGELRLVIRGISVMHLVGKGRVQQGEACPQSSDL